MRPGLVVYGVNGGRFQRGYNVYRLRLALVRTLTCYLLKLELVTNTLHYESGIVKPHHYQAAKLVLVL